MPSDTVIDKWLGEPIKAAILPTSIFLTNKKGFPVLAKAHQRIVFRLFKVNVPDELTVSSHVYASQCGYLTCCRLHSWRLSSFSQGQTVTARKTCAPTCSISSTSTKIVQHLMPMRCLPEAMKITYSRHYRCVKTHISSCFALLSYFGDAIVKSCFFISH